MTPAENPKYMSRLEAAIALQRAGNNRGAARAFMELFEDFSTEPRLADEAGNIYLYAVNDPGSAIPCYERALPLVGDPTQICFKIGFAYASMGDDDSASDWFARAHAHTPNDPDTFLEVAKLCMRRGHYRDALEYFTTAWAHHVGTSMLRGGPNPHFRLIVLMNQARIQLLHLDELEAGIAIVRSLLDDHGDVQRVEKLAAELDDAGQASRAARVRSMLARYEAS